MYNKQLILEDGTVYKGYGFGASGEVKAELKLNYSMSGYETTLADKDYANKIVVFSYPLIGNYGVNKEDFHGKEVTLSGMIVKEVCDKPSNFGCEYTLDEAMKKFNIVGIYGIDTRSLMRKLRNKTMKVCITDLL